MGELESSVARSKGFQVAEFGEATMDIIGTSDNDTITGTGGDDVIYPKGGLDTVAAGDGDDQIVIDVQPAYGSVFDGGAGFDTLVLRSQPGYVSNAGNNTWGYLLTYPTQVNNIEAVRFASDPGSQLYTAFMSYVIDGGLKTVIGGAGGDILLDVVFTPGTYLMPDFVLSNWSNDILGPNSDYVSLYVSPAATGDFTLRAREGLASVQSLFAGAGGTGNDVLIGSSGSEILTAGRGIDQLYGNGGTDILRADNLTAFGATPAVKSYAGDIFDGGTETDYLEVGGAVDLSGAAISNIEVLNLLPAFPAPGPGGAGRAATALTLSSQTASGLAANLQVQGSGTVTVNMTSGTAFNGSGYQIQNPANIAFTINGTSGNDAITGTSDDDVIVNGGGLDTIHAGDGNDTILINAKVEPGSVLDGGAGFDTLELKTQAAVPSVLGGTLTQYEIYFPTAVTSIEAAKFDSNAGDVLSLVVLEPQRAASGLNTLIGGAGRDLFYNVVFQGGTYTMPNLTLTNWTSDLNDPNSDFVVLYASNGDNYVLNAREGLFALQSLQGNAGNDILNGSSGRDFLAGKDGINQLYGNGGDDLLYAENIQVFGQPETPWTFAGNLYDGGSGQDSLLVGGRVNFQGTLVNVENIYLEPATPNYPGFSGLNAAYLTLSGTNALTLASNARIGGAGTVVINLDAGSSTFDISGWTFAQAGPINYFGNGFDATINVFGTGGNDTIRDSDAADVVWGNGGDDTIYGNGGDDAIRGGAGADTLYGGDGNDWIFGGFTRDIVQPQPGDLGDLIDGGAGDDRIRGGDGDDILLGGIGNDNLRGDAGNDVIDGGDGFDQVGYNFSNQIAAVTLDASAIHAGSEQQAMADGFGGTDLLSNVEWVSLSGSLSGDVLKGSNTLVNELLGNGGDDTITGGSADDMINGGDGNDVLRGLGGSDTITGGAGDDQLYGAYGLNPAGYAGDGADYLDGGDGNDLLRGSDGDDTLLGGAGDDNLRGDAGADVIDGGDGFDFAGYLFNDLTGPVNIDMRSVTGGAAAQQVVDGRGSFDTLSNIEKIGIAGTESNDTLRGSTTLQNQLAGFGGDDFIRGGNTTDFIDGGDGNDDIRGNGGSDEIYGGAGNDTLIGGFNGFGAPQPGDGADYLDGGEGNDVIRGGDGDDTLLGGAGDDNLNGNLGNDYLDGGDGFDFFINRFDDLTTGMTIDMRDVTGGPDAQQINDLRGGIDTVVNMERFGVLGTSGDDVIFGSATLGNQLFGGLGNDAITGGSASDLFSGGLGNDTIEGGGDYDYASFAGNMAGYSVTALAPGQWQVTDIDASDGDEGTDLLSGIEELYFADTNLVLDLAPYADDGTAAGNEDSVIAGSVSGSDPESDPLSFALVSGPAHGTLVFDASGSFTYTPNADYNGPDSFLFTASDGTFTSPAATMALTVSPVADAAVIGGVTTGLLTEGTVSGAPAGQTGGLITVSDPDGPAQLTAQTAASLYGSFALLANGTWTYTLAEASTAVQSLNPGSTVTDSFGITSDDGTVSQVVVTIKGANDAAVIGGQTSGTVQESAALGGTSQVAGTLTISDVDNLAQFVAGSFAGLYGTLTLSAAGSWTYLLNNANAAVDGLSAGQSLNDTFNVTAADGTTQALALTIAGANDLRTGTQQADLLTGTAGGDTLNGLGGNDTLNGGLGNDVMDGGNGTDTATYAGLGSGVTVSLAISAAQNTGAGGIDTLLNIENLTGTAFADVLNGNSAANIIDGGAGDDTIDGGAGNDTLIGGAGIDTASYASATSAVTVSLATTSSQNTGGAGSDILSGFENLTGSNFADKLTGSSAANVIDGGAGADRITGAGGADVLFGGLGDDTFSYAALLDSGPSAAARDVIRDFQGAGLTGGDLIDLSAIDAIAGGRDNAFNFIGNAAFHNVAGELRYDTTSTPGYTIVQADTNGDGVADLSIALQWGSNAQPLELIAQDFVM